MNPIVSMTYTIDCFGPRMYVLYCCEEVFGLKRYSYSVLCILYYYYFFLFQENKKNNNYKKKKKKKKKKVGGSKNRQRAVGGCKKGS